MVGNLHEVSGLALLRTGRITLRPAHPPPSPPPPMPHPDEVVTTAAKAGGHRVDLRA
jgi:hypothetical protein